MLCPNCGRVLDEIATRCDGCGYEMSAGRGTEEKINKETANNTYIPESPAPYRAGSEHSSARWVGPRRVVHICSIVAGIQAIYSGYLLYTVMGLASFFGADTSGMEAEVWCILFGIILTILGIVGLVKIHSNSCCLVLAGLHIIAVLPFVNYKYLLIPRTDIFIAFWISLCAIAICGAAWMKSEGVVSGWIMLAFLVGLVIYVNVYYDGNQAANAFWENKTVQSENFGERGTQETITATPVPTTPPQTVYTGQDWEDSYYVGQNTDNSYDDDYEDDEDYDDDEDYEDEESSYDYAAEETEDDEEDGYIFPNSDSTYLTKADVKGMSAKELNLAKNELYARHGRIFDREDLQEYFDSCSWYEPLYTRKEWDKKGDKYFFSEIEIKNRNFLVKKEKNAKK